MEKIQKSKFWSGSIYLHKVFDLEKMINDYQANQMLFCLNTKQSFLYMDAFGICMTARNFIGQLLIESTGKRKYVEMQNAIR